jgi:hypothetical protein
MISRALLLTAALALLCTTPAAALILNLGVEEVIEAGGLPISVDSYSVPSLVDWNDDGLPDLLVGEGGGLFQGRVRVYLNEGIAGAPAFTAYFHVLSDGQELVVPGNG